MNNQLSQIDFYNTPEVRALLEIQKANRYGSEEHKAAYHKISCMAKKYGVYDEYIKSDGGTY